MAQVLVVELSKVSGKGRNVKLGSWRDRQIGRRIGWSAVLGLKGE